MLSQIFGAIAESATSAAIDKCLQMLNMADFENPEFRSALMAKVALEADGANIDITKLRAFTSANSFLSKYTEDLEKQLIGWVEKVAKAGGKAAAQGAIESLHLEELALSALFGLAHLIFMILMTVH